MSAVAARTGADGSTAAALLATLREAGVSVRAEAGEIVLTASPGAVPPAVLDALRVRKADLIEILKGDRCRRCGGRLDYLNDRSTRAFGDGSGAHGCYYLLAAERAVLSPGALADEAELTMRGEPLP